MAENETSTPEEKPLHDIVLALMFQANKERPAQLTVRDVFWNFTDEAVTENNVIEVLKWLVHQKRVEYSAGKYSLDRFEFLDQIRIDNAEIGPDGKLKLAEFEKSDLPLHDVILGIMFEADKEKPAEFTPDDILWKILDPSVNQGQVIEVLKWLLYHKRVDFQSGKYSLDRFEFLEQAKEEKTEKKEKKTKKPAKKTVAETPKPLKETKPVKSPKVEKKEKAPKVEAEPVSVPKTEELKPEPKPKPKSTPKPKPEPEAKPEVIPVEIPQVKEPIQVIEKSPVINNILLSIAAVLFAYTFYVLISASNGTAPETSNQLQNEIVSAELRLTELSKTEENSSRRLEIVEEKLDLIQEISSKKIEQNELQNKLIDDRNRSLIVRLIFSNLLILLIFGVVYYRRTASNSVLPKNN